MPKNKKLSGVFAAVITPLDIKNKIALEEVPSLLSFLANRGCHGALLLGTTGEGPSFSFSERENLVKTALHESQSINNFRLLVGTGTPSLEETASLTKSAFNMGADGVVVLPPYYYRKATEEGLFAWYSQLILKSVPDDGLLLGYHIPQISGVPLSVGLLRRLKDNFPKNFAGIKDSSGDPEHARKLGKLFGDDLLVFSGNDRLFTYALRNQASGCITALANLCSQDLRIIWDAHLNGGEDKEAQSRLDAGRKIIDKYQPAPPLLKALLNWEHGFPKWNVRPPLVDLPTEIQTRVIQEAEYKLSISKK
jgi:4-hydroxy-tetrahydrodipicolinate synthase